MMIRTARLHCAFWGALLAAFCALALVPCIAHAWEDTAALDEQGTVVDVVELPGSTLSGDDFADAGPTANLDEEDLFAGYVKQLFSSPRKQGPAVLRAGKQLRRNRLNDQEKIAYDLLEERVVAIASGQETSSVLSVPLSTFGVKRAYKAADLGLETIFDETVPGTVSEAARQAVNAQLAIGQQSVMCALMADHPYEMYWFDKTVGIAYAMPQLGAVDNGSGGAVVFETGAALKFSMAVSAHYSKDGNVGSFVADAAKTSRASTAATNAQGIVDQNSSLGDYEKLKAYADKIVELTDYNYASVEEYELTGIYGDPWQLVYLFDGDPTTKVVCEGYSKGFQYLCDSSEFADATLSVDCLSGDMYAGTGDTTEGYGPHMWNVVHWGGKNYLVDLTNSDCVVENPKECAAAKNYELFVAGAEGIVDEGEYGGCYIEWENEVPGAGAHWISYYYDAETLQFFGADEYEISETSYLEDLEAAGKEKITVSVAVLGDAFHGQGARHTFAQGNLSTWLDAVTVEVPEGSTALAALSKALREHSYSGSVGADGSITRIEQAGGNALSAGANGSNSAWLWMLNGAYTSSTLAETTVSAGDALVVHYSDDVRYEANSGVTVVTVSVLGDACHGEDGHVHTYAGGGLETWIDATELELPGKQATVLDALNAACDEAGYELAVSNGTYIAGVGPAGDTPLSEFDNGRLSGWKYLLNGAYPSVSAARQQVRSGDEVVLHYTDNYRIDDTSFDADAHADMLAVLQAINGLSGAKDLERLDGEDDDAYAARIAKAAQDAADAADAFAALPESDRLLAGEGVAQRLEACEQAAAAAQEAAVSDADRAQAVVDAIDAIGKVGYNDASKAAIEAARAVYDALTAEQQALVTNARALKNAEAAYAKLEAAAKETGGKTDGGTDATDASTSDADGKTSTAASASSKKPLAKGKKFTVKTAAGTFTYKVTGKLCVTLVSSKTTKKKALSINTVKNGSFAYKVTAFGSRALKGAKITSAKLGSNVKSVGASAFVGCKNLKTVVIGKNVASISKKAFSKCSKMKSLTVGRKVKTVKAGAFKSCKKLCKVTVKSTKLTKASCKNLITGTKISKVKLSGVSSKAKKSYKKWFPKKVANKKVVVK